MSSLVEKATEVLKLNDRRTHTVPSQHLYPHMWAWDSAFAAIGWSHIDKSRALAELQFLMSVAWKEDGRVPHIHFDQESLKNYFPGPDIWGHGMSSTITQPPAWALAAEHLYDMGVDKESLLQLLPAIDRSHQFFFNCRDPLDWGLVAVVHPWESGRDNCPAWDEPLNAVDPELAPPFKRVDTKIVSDPSTRPSNDEYKRYIALVDQIKKADFGVGQFFVYDPMMSSILAMAEGSLARLGDKLGFETQAKARQKRMIQALKDRLWDEDTRSFWFYDVSAQKKYHAPIISAYFPLLIDGYDEKLAADLLADLKTHHWAEYPLSTVRTDDEKFTPNCYWRGPSWLVLNWFFHKAFGDEIIDKSIKLIEKGGFREYFNPLTGEGYGAQQFSWSAALLIDMIHKKSC